MSDELKPNLEPIDEGELNLKEKFLGGAETEKVMGDSVPQKEAIVIPENIAEKLERKEGVSEKDETYAKIMAKVATSQPAPVKTEEVTDDAAKASQEMDAESKIGNLVNLAETKGVAHAVKVARHMEDNFVLDEFHDRLLADELHNALVKKGLIKEL